MHCIGVLECATRSVIALPWHPCKRLNRREEQQEVERPLAKNLGNGDAAVGLGTVTGQQALFVHFRQSSVEQHDRRMDDAMYRAKPGLNLLLGRSQSHGVAGIGAQILHCAAIRRQSA